MNAIGYRDYKRDLIDIEIGHNLYTECDMASRIWWCKEKTGIWGDGIINYSGDEYRAQRIGILGEVAVATHLGIKYDLKYKQRGGDIDLHYEGYAIEVKTTEKDYGKGYVRYTDEYGRLKPLKADFYFFCFIKNECAVEKKATVSLAGCCQRKFLESLDIEKSPRGNWYNYVPEYCTLAKP